VRHLLLIGIVLVLAARPARADDRDQCLSASSAAQDLRRARKLIEARTQLLTCVRDVCPAVVRRDCVTWLSEVEAGMPTLVVAARDGRGNDIVAARILMDGAVFLDRLEGKALPVNPGVHTIRLEVDRAAPVEQQVVIKEGEKNRLLELAVVVPTEPPPAGATTTPPRQQPSGTMPPATPPAPTRDRSRSRTLGLGLTITGGLGIGVGVIFGLRASSRWSDAQTACGTGCQPGSPAYQLRDEAQTAGNVSTISVIVGGAALATGLILLVRKKEPGPIATAIARGVTTGGLGYAGTF